MNLSGNTLGGAVNRYSMGDRPVSQVIGELVKGVASRVGAIALTVACLAVVLASCLSAPLTANASPLTLAALPSGNPISNGKALLRYSLPIDNETIRDVQGNLEGMSNDLRAKRWGPIDKKAKKAQRVLEKKSDDLLVGVPDSFMPEAKDLVAQIGTGLEDLRLAVDERDREAIWTKRNEILDRIGAIEESMVTEFPFEVPEDYANLPQLKGRATVELETSRGTIQITVDGYNAPVTAGNFVDLVQRGFYDNLPFIRAEDSYVLQFGDPEGPDEGFNDPKTGEYRAVPLEIMVEGDTDPLYGYTTEEIGLFKKLPVLPFSAYGALAMARPESNNNGGSSQVFFFLFEPELTPAGANLLDGRYAVFGYTISDKNGKPILDKMRAGDKVISAKVVSGAENLVQPA
ncbi:MAG: peptidylprolyl isomerase [Cyanophyceae cyanobacterium]